ncbi:hypothetical protein [Haloferula sp. BvORR071]|uniref:hypothetical protein n=1 Tax=Haloferula sp. BvORR071 TaxID=1396141 RepID=UPI000553115C|nr:hypothetical protein [Haloferula sp. BvORR071]
MKLLLFAFSSLLLTLASGFAQTTPQEMTKAYYDAQKAKDFDALAKLFDPAELKAFRTKLDFLTDLPDEDGAAVITAFFGEEATKESVKKLDDLGFFATFLKSAAGAGEDAGGTMPDDVKVVGEVKEGEDRIHVVTRCKTGAGELQVESMEVMSFKKIGDAWKAQLSGAMAALPAQVRQSFGK